MTLGTDRVRLSFNPSGHLDVQDIKQRAADCIDWCDGKRTEMQALHQSKGGDEKITGERLRCLALAMTAFEEAAMWAVKAIT